MEVNDGNQVAGAGGDDLLHRMQEAHDEQVEGKDFDRAGRGEGVGESGRVAEVDESDPVERRAMDTARKALDGEFEEDREVRREVIASIVEERYAGMAGVGTEETLVDSVEEALVDDAAFRSEVDNMLLHAARRVGEERSSS